MKIPVNIWVVINPKTDEFVAEFEDDLGCYFGDCGGCTNCLLKQASFSGFKIISAIKYVETQPTLIDWPRQGF